MTKIRVNSVTSPSQRMPRKNVNIWTRDKITRLIQLYRQHACLWNNYIEAYKNKARRNQAINDICTTLRITRFEFGKKIHNLRNQFNAEMKKLDRRIEESGGSNGSAGSDHLRSRWDHYDSLIFLKNVIAPRPGYQISANYQHPRKFKMKCKESLDNNEPQCVISRVDDFNVTDIGATAAATTAVETEAMDEETEYHFDEATAEEETGVPEQESAEDFRNFEAETIPTATTHSEEAIDQKYNPPSLLREVIITSLPAQPTSQPLTNSNTTKTTHCTPVQINHTIETRSQSQSSNSNSKNNNNNSNIIINNQSQPLSPHKAMVAEQKTLPDQCSTLSMIESQHSKHLPIGRVAGFHASSEVTTVAQRSTQASSDVRDQWDAFGEMVAAELRNLNSNSSRKKLKRKIMQAMLEVGEEDDGININIAIN